MHLLLSGQALPIAQLGLDFLVLDQPLEHPAGLAEILLKVDGFEKRWMVRLPNGLSATDRRIAIDKA